MCMLIIKVSLHLRVPVPSGKPVIGSYLTHWREKGESNQLVKLNEMNETVPFLHYWEK